MSEGKSHKAAANKIAEKYNTDYNDDEGVDIQSKRATVEVETEETVQEAKSQLQGHKGPVYIAGTNQEAVEKALETTKNTTIGVMDKEGTILKRSTRKK